MGITFNEAVASHINNAIKKRGTGVGMRLSIKVMGCSGFGYVMDYCDTINDDDHVFNEHGAKVVVDDKSLKIIDGTAIDFKKVDLNKQFVFNNPRAVAECGCGESFSIDKNAEE